jgi:hypothetical protein
VISQSGASSKRLTLIGTDPRETGTPRSLQQFPPRLSLHFRGRGKELCRIRDALKPPNSNVPSYCILWGEAGVGKTQLALKYVEQVQHGLYHIFWVRASSVEKINRDLSCYLDRLDKSCRNISNQEDRLVAVKNILETDSQKWLLVLDNVDDKTSGHLLNILPTRNSNGSAIITTRTQVDANLLSARKQCECLEIRKPPLKDALHILLRSDNLGDSKAPREIIDTIGRLPLNLDFVASYKEFLQCSFDSILDIYKDDKRKDRVNDIAKLVYI